MRYILICFTILIALTSTQAQGPAFLKVVAELENALPKEQALYIRGSHSMMGNWQHGKVRLAKKAEKTWGGIFLINKGDSISFVIDGGSKAKQFASIDTVSLLIKTDTSVSLTIPGQLENAEPEYEAGTMHKIPASPPGNMRDRLVMVRTPFGYEKDTSRTYPTLYLMDAQSLFDPQTSPDGNSWALDKTLDSLEQEGLIEPVILVAIEHVWDVRSMEYSDTELGQRYRDYLSQHLVPSIDRQFRTSQLPKDRIVGGAVAGGFVSLMTAWEHPEVFGNVMALSPAVKIEENDFLAQVDTSSGPPKNLDIYIDHGEFGLDEKLGPGVQTLKAYLKENGCSFEHKFQPNTIPDSENMAHRVKPGILYLLGTKAGHE